MLEEEKKDLERRIDQLGFYVGTSTFSGRLSYLYGKVKELALEDESRAKNLFDLLRMLTFENDKVTKEYSKGSYKAIIDFAVSRNREDYMNMVIFENNSIADIINATVLCNKFLEVFNIGVLKQGVVNKAVEMYKEKVRYGVAPSVAQDYCENYINSLEEHKICVEMELLDAIMAFRTAIGVAMEQGPFGVDSRITSELTRDILQKQHLMSSENERNKIARASLISKLTKINRLYIEWLEILENSLEKGKYMETVSVLEALLENDKEIIDRGDIINLDVYYNEAARYQNRLAVIGDMKNRFAEAVSELRVDDIKSIAQDLKAYLVNVINFCTAIINKEYL